MWWRRKLRGDFGEVAGKFIIGFPIQEGGEAGAVGGDRFWGVSGGAFELAPVELKPAEQLGGIAGDVRIRVAEQVAEHDDGLGGAFGERRPARGRVIGREP